MQSAHVSTACAGGTQQCKPRPQPTAPTAPTAQGPQVPPQKCSAPSPCWSLSQYWVVSALLTPFLSSCLPPLKAKSYISRSISVSVGVLQTNRSVRTSGDIHEEIFQDLVDMIAGAEKPHLLCSMCKLNTQKTGGVKGTEPGVRVAKGRRRWTARWTDGPPSSSRENSPFAAFCPTLASGRGWGLEACLLNFPIQMLISVGTASQTLEIWFTSDLGIP